MDRIETIREYLKPYIVERVREKIKTTNSTPKNYLISSVADLIREAIEREEMQTQWKPSYMGLFHLMSSLITESYKFELIIADKQMYLDENQVISHWCPSFLYQDVQEEEYIRNKLQKQFVRLNSYEISYAKRFIFYEYRNIAGVYWRECLDEIIKLEEFRKMKKDIPFLFLFGDYMGEIHKVLDYGEVL